MGDPKLVITGDVSQLEKALHKAERKIDNLAGKLKKSGQTGKKAMDGVGASMTKAFDPAKLVGMLAGFVSIQKAIGLIKSGLDDLERRRAEAARMIIETEMPAAKLAQLTKTAAEYRKLLETGKMIFEAGGAKTLEEAYATTFQLKSAGALAEAGFFARLKGVVPEIPEVAGAAAKIQAAMGIEETGALRGIVGKGITAAAPVTDVGVREMLLGATKAAGIAGRMGISDEELMSTLSIIAQKTESAEIAGTHLKQMLTTFMIKPEFKGLSIREMVDKVGEKGLEGAALKKWFGRVQGMQAYLALTGTDIAGRTAEIAAGAGEAGKRIAIAMGAPEVREPRELRERMARTTLRAEPAGRRRIRADIALEEIFEQEGEGIFASIGFALRKAIQKTFGDVVLANMMFDETTATHIIAGRGVQLSGKAESVSMDELRRSALTINEYLEKMLAEMSAKNKVIEDPGD